MRLSDDDGVPEDAAKIACTRVARALWRMELPFASRDRESGGRECVAWSTLKEGADRMCEWRCSSGPSTAVGRRGSCRRWANYWAAKEWTATVLTFDEGGVGPAYHVHESVEHRPLDIAGDSDGILRAIVHNGRRLRTLRHAIRKCRPDVVLSFIDKVNVLTIFATVGLGVPVVVSERIDPRHSRIGVLWRMLRLCCYRYAARVVVQTRNALEFFPERVRRRACVIPNPVCAVRDGVTIGRFGRPSTIVGMGRLSHQKGFDLLLRAVATIAGTHRSWSLVIWGEGECRAELEGLRDQLGLRGRASFPGWTAEPVAEMTRAGIFVLPSRYEGFPNVLCEAMACGIPVVSFDCPSGPREIVRNGVDGILVTAEDVGALARALGALLENESERRRLAERATEVTDRFGVQRVMSMWERVLFEAME